MFLGLFTCQLAITTLVSTIWMDNKFQPFPEGKQDSDIGKFTSSNNFALPNSTHLRHFYAS